MRDLDATQQTSPEPVSRMSVETTHPPNEHDNIFKQLDKHVCGAKLQRLMRDLTREIVNLWQFTFFFL